MTPIAFESSEPKKQTTIAHPSPVRISSKLDCAAGFGYEAQPFGTQHRGLESPRPSCSNGVLLTVPSRGRILRLNISKNSQLKSAIDRELGSCHHRNIADNDESVLLGHRWCELDPLPTIAVYRSERVTMPSLAILGLQTDAEDFSARSRRSPSNHKCFVTKVEGHEHERKHDNHNDRLRTRDAIAAYFP
ncbi:hypothetical protein SCHPADRAFT_929711 [Schizopora paradoxa]|uniref:Uncharacterized protein n=1 Tax=Schizopora paradoxa TaxID=27342 RepID=A0A0H2S462_9AGAM|nr:hypothetical protein SCHPADRAFT_929711 [Schizopora paradoxa]